MYMVGQAPTHIYEAPDFANMNTTHESGKTVMSLLPAYTVSPAAQVWNGPPAGPLGTHVIIVTQNINSSPAFHRTFLKAKPKALGIVIIVAAVLQAALGIARVSTVYGITLISGISFWGSVCYIIAGSLTISAYCKPNICMVKGSLSLNIISSVFSFIAFILNCVDLVLLKLDSYNYNHSNYQDIINRGYAIMSLLLTTNLLLFCVTLSVSIFGCRSLAHETVPQVFMVQNPSTVAGAFPAGSSSTITEEGRH